MNKDRVNQGSLRPRRSRSRWARDLAQASCGGIRRVANGVAGNHEFNPAVFLAPCGVIIRSYWQRVTEAFRSQCVCRYALFDQVTADSAGAILRQLLVHVITAHVVGVTANLNVEAWISDEDSSHLRKFFPSARLQ